MTLAIEHALSLFSDYRGDDLATPGLDVAFEVKDLLPCAEDGRAVANRHGE